LSSAILKTGGVSVVSAGIEMTLSGLGGGQRGVSSKENYFWIWSEGESERTL
jgi:hypothetical protein